MSDLTQQEMDLICEIQKLKCKTDELDTYKKVATDLSSQIHLLRQDNTALREQLSAEHDACMSEIKKNSTISDQLTRCVAMLETMDGWLRQIGCKDNIVGLLLAEIRKESK